MAVQTEGKFGLTPLELVQSDSFLYVLPQICLCLSVCVWGGGWGAATLVRTLMFKSLSATLTIWPLSSQMLNCDMAIAIEP